MSDCNCDIVLQELRKLKIQLAEAKVIKQSVEEVEEEIQRAENQAWERRMGEDL